MRAWRTTPLQPPHGSTGDRRYGDDGCDDPSPRRAVVGIGLLLTRRRLRRPRRRQGYAARGAACGLRRLGSRCGLGRRVADRRRLGGVARGRSRRFRLRRGRRLSRGRRLDRRRRRCGLRGGRRRGWGGGSLTVVAGAVVPGASAVVAGRADPPSVSVAVAGGASGLVVVSGGVGLVVAGAVVAGTLPASSVVVSAVRVAASELRADPAPELSPPPQPASAPAQPQTSSSARTQRARARGVSGRVAEAGAMPTTGRTFTGTPDRRNRRSVDHLGERLLSGRAQRPV